MQKDYSVTLWIMFGLVVAMACVFAFRMYQDNQREWAESNKAWDAYRAREQADNPPAPAQAAPVVMVAPQPTRRTTGDGINNPMRSHGSLATLGQYNRIFNGMSYSEVVAIMGREGDQISNMSMSMGGTLESRRWSNEGRGSMSVSFENGFVYAKSQFLLPK